MSNRIKLKRGTGSNPSTSDLVVGEVALRTDNGKLFTKKDDGNIAEIGTGLSDGDKGDLTISNSGTTFTIDSGVINNAKVASDAAIALSKLATGTLPSGLKINHNNLQTGIIENENISSSAAIAGSKISPNFGSQNIVTTGTIGSNNITITGSQPFLSLQDAEDENDYEVGNAGGLFRIRDVDAATNRLTISSAGVTTIAGNLDVGAGIDVTGAITSTGNLTITNTQPRITFADSNNNPDYLIDDNAGALRFYDVTNGATRLQINGDGHVDIDGNLDVGAGIDVTGNIDITDGTLIIDTTPDSPNTSFGLQEALRIDDNGATNDRHFSIYEYRQGGGRFFSINMNLTSGSTGSAYQYTQGNWGGSSMIRFNNGATQFFADDQVTGGSNDVITPTERFKVNTNGVVVTGNISVTGTVDGVDIAARNTLFGGLTSSSGVLTDGVTATTQSASDNSTKVATTAYTDTAISNLVDSSPSTLNTLNELAAALGDDANFSTTVTNSIATKLPLAGGTLTGSVTIDKSGTANITIKSSDDYGTIEVGGSTGAFIDLKSPATDDYDIRFTHDGFIYAKNNITLSPTSGNVVNVARNLNAQEGLDVTGNITTTSGNLTVDGTGSVEDVFKISDSAGGQRLLMGNRDSAGVDCPKIFNVGNAALTIGIGDSWSGDGGTLTSQFTIAKNGTITSVGNHDFSAGIDVTGNITVTGTVDGRDVAADGTKLDAIEGNYVREIQTQNDLTTRFDSGFYETSTATTGEGWPVTSNGWYHLIASTHSNTTNYYSMQIAGDFFNQKFYIRNTHNSGTRAWSEIWTSSSDGAGSGLDSDTVDGIEGASFLRSDANDTATGNIEFTGHVRIVTGDIDNTNTTKGLMFDAGYEDGRYRTRIRKDDKGGGIPLYIDSSDGTANSYTAIARFGGYTNNTEKFEVFGTAKATTFSGSGASLTNIPAGQLTGTIADARIPDIITPATRVQTSEVRTGNGQQLILNAGESNGKVSGQTGEYVYVNAEAGLSVNTPDSANANWQGGTASNQTLITGTAITIDGNTVFHQGNDGSGSGLDADKLDGEEGSYYRNASNINAGTLAAARVATLNQNTTGSAASLVLGNDSTGSSAKRIVFASADSGTVTIQADTNSGATYTPSTGTISAQIFNGSGSGLSNLNASNLASGTIPAARLSASDLLTKIKTVDGNGSGLDADTLDGIGSGSFLRSDANDTYTGTLSLAGHIVDSGDSRSVKLMGGTTNSQPFLGIGEQSLYGMKIRWDSSQSIEFDGFWNTSVDGARNKDLGSINVNTSTWNFPAATFSNGINVGDLANGGITGNNYDITGVNSLAFNDPGEGIIFKSGLTLILIDDDNDNICNFDGAAELRVNNSKVWHAGNDGSSSGLDSDKLDGQEGSYYRNAGNINAGTLNAARLPNHSAALLTSGTIPDARISGNFLKSNASDTMTGTLTIGDGSAQTELHIKKADNNVSDHLQFYNGTTRMGEIGCEDTTWLRINQETAKNIYTPRYIRADAGFFVDGTTKGINGSGNFTGGTIAGASDYSTLIRSDANDNVTGHTEWQDSYEVRLGAGADMRLYHNGSQSYIDNHTSHLYIRNAGSNDNANIYIQARDDENSIICEDDADVRLFSNGTEVFRTDTTNSNKSKHLYPWTNNAYDLGSTSLRWKNLYVNDMHFSNHPENPNSVDGTWGDWTLQEGENDIFMINNRSGKKFKIAMIPV
tara:strand:+ start:1497 stop:6623 length:5127 start_codon:yes stop_codon:yes gene_type:complete